MMIEAKNRDDRLTFFNRVRVLPTGQGLTLPNRQRPPTRVHAVPVYSLNPFAAAPAWPEPVAVATRAGGEVVSAE